MKEADNILANGSGGIIGTSRGKESVLKWNLINDEKLKHAQFIDDICDISEEINGFSHYHEFPCKTIADEEIYVNFIFKFLDGTGDIPSDGDLQNIVTGEVLDK